MAPSFVDALRNEQPEYDDIRFYANARDGAPARLTYGFMDHAPAWSPSGDAGNPRRSFEAFDSEDRRVASPDVV